LGEAGTETALAGGGKVIKALKGPKIDPSIKINDILGVKATELRPGSSPASVNEFITNPGRGVLKAGLDEKALAKMNPLERNAAIIKAKGDAGKQLDATLQAATQQGKTVSLRQPIDETFKNIPNKALQAQTKQKLTQIVNKALGRPNVFENVPYTKILQDLDKLTPMQARTIQRGLDDFANFSDEATAKTFRDVASQLRRQISAETRKVVPESAEFDKQYGDLANASEASERQATDFARTTPESRLRKLIIKAAVKAGKMATTGMPLP
jgi:hypothetical protein